MKERKFPVKGKVDLRKEIEPVVCLMVNFFVDFVDRKSAQPPRLRVC